jgi:hypothetical protein
MYRWKNGRIVDDVPNLKDSNYQTIIDKFQPARNCDPSCNLARENLAIAHHNFALYLLKSEHKSADSLRQFHQAAYIDPSNRCTSEHVSGFMRDVLHMNPKSFADRAKLGDQSKAGDDLAGAAVEGGTFLTAFLES